jgi:hypothetical protein
VKYLERSLPMLDALHEVGCGRDKAGNRCLHFDQYCILILLALFNPVVRSLRAIQQVSESRNVQRKLGCERASLRSLSEAVEVFEPDRLLGRRGRSSLDRRGPSRVRRAAPSGRAGGYGRGPRRQAAAEHLAASDDRRLRTEPARRTRATQHEARLKQERIDMDVEVRD